jgi:ATP-dependent phosphofructokinase / diphosphate-dependent phosphofructokinase
MRKEIVGIVVGGGPAPGINGVISAATIEAINEGKEVIGIVGGFNSLFEGRGEIFRNLTIDEVSRIHNRGGSILRTSRNYEGDAQDKIDTLVFTLKRFGIKYLIAIGGEGSLFMANWIRNETKGSIKVVHVPKTIDNDIPLPWGLSTFGYQTARHVGVQLVTNLMEDARTMGRWYFITTMGRHAGHLALGIGKAAGATITLIPEEFTQEKVPVSKVAAILAGSIIKRLAMERDHGVVVMAEGLIEKLDIREEDLGQYDKDEMGRMRLSEVHLGEILKNAVKKILGRWNLKATIVEKDIGYELRAADPIPFDIEYTRNLGYGAVRCLMSGGTGSTITSYRGHLTPVPFEDLVDPETGKAKIRPVDMDSATYEVARKYMIRLEPQDFEGDNLSSLCHVLDAKPEDFREVFAPAVS